MESSKHTNGVEETDSGVTQKQEKKVRNWCVCVLIVLHQNFSNMYTNHVHI